MQYQVGSLGAIQQLEDRSDEQLRSESKHRAAARAILGARAAERYDVKQARTYFNDNLVTVVVQDLMTKGEHSLIRDGRGDLVLQTRRAYQDTMGDELSAGVEDITGREVVAFLSANHLHPDIRHRANDATISLALVARGLAVTMLPELPLEGRRRGVALRAIAEGPVDRAIFAATRAADAARPSTQALVAAVRDAAAALGAPPSVSRPRARA